MADRHRRGGVRVLAIGAVCDGALWALARALPPSAQGPVGPGWFAWFGIAAWALLWVNLCLVPALGGQVPPARLAADAARAALAVLAGAVAGLIAGFALIVGAAGLFTALLPSAWIAGEAGGGWGLPALTLLAIGLGGATAVWVQLRLAGGPTLRGGLAMAAGGVAAVALFILPEAPSAWASLAVAAVGAAPGLAVLAMRPG